MITLTRLSGSVFALNSDLIERVDSTPDTVITLVDGTKYVVRESLSEIVVAVREYRGQIVALGARITEEHDAVAAVHEPAPRPLLSAVSSHAGQEQH